MKAAWEVKPLGEVCDVINGLWKGKKGPYQKAKVVRNTNFRPNGVLNLDDVAEIEVELKQLEKRQLSEGDIVLERSGGGPKQPVGRVILFHLDEPNFSFSNFTSVIRVNDTSEVYPKFLHAQLNFWYAAGLTEPLQKQSTGIRNLDFKAYQKLPVSIPPLEEQKRIVAVLDAAFEGLTRAKENAETNLQNARELFERSTDAFLTERLSGAPLLALSEVANLDRGHNPPKSDFIYEEKEGYVRFYQIRDRKSDKFAVYVPDTPKLHRVEPHEILMTAYRHIGEVFRGASGAFNVALCKLSSKSEETLLHDFLFAMIPTSYVKGELLRYSERSLIPSMSIKHLETITIPVPNVGMQSTVVEELKRLAVEAGTLEQAYTAKLTDIADLRQSLLQKAFAGELT